MLLKQVRQTVCHFHMLNKASRVIVGLSGGADSVALLHLLTRLQANHPFSLLAVHVHHGLRDADADADAHFAEEFAKSLGVDFEIVFADVAAEAKKRGLGLEEAGRIIRYESFESFAYLEDTHSCIAVAHHQNDQAETVLMRLCRGTGMVGLCGMHPVRDNIIRPLLFCSRKEIEAYCAQHQLYYQIDKTNLENEYTRNKIRNQLIPWLEKELNTNAVFHIAKTAALLADEEEYMQAAAEDAMHTAMAFQNKYEVGFFIHALQALPTALRRRGFRHAIHLVAGQLIDISQAHIEQIEELLLAQSGKVLSLPNGLYAEIAFDKIIIYTKKEQTESGYEYLLIPEKTIFIKEIKKYVQLSYNAEKKERNFGRMYTEVFDYDTIKNVVYCRTRQPSDKMAIGGGHTKKIKDFFVDEKIPKRQRDSWPLIAIGNEILWVVGKRRANDFAVGAKSKNRVVISIWEDTGNERESGNADNENSNQ